MSLKVSPDVSDFLLSLKTILSLMKSSSKIDHEHFYREVQGSALNEFAFAISTQFIFTIIMICRNTNIISFPGNKKQGSLLVECPAFYFFGFLSVLLVQ